MLNRNQICNRIEQLMSISQKLWDGDPNKNEVYGELLQLLANVDGGWDEKEWNENKVRLDKHLWSIESDFNDIEVYKQEQDFSEKEIEELARKSSIEQKLKTNKYTKPEKKSKPKSFPLPVF